MTTPYRAAVIGLGRMGSTFDDEKTQGGAIYFPYCHTPAYVASPRTKLVGGADRHDEQRAIYAERWGTNVYADHRELLEKEKPDIVSVCTSARARPAIVDDVARSGARAIWAEKPIALTLAEADRMVAVCAENNVTIAANCARRWNPHYQTARELIEAGEIGEVSQITAYYLCNLSHNGSHGIDAMRYLTLDGNVSWVFGEIESDEAAFGEDDPRGNGYFVFDNGVRGFLRSTPCGPIATREFDVLGTEGRIRILENTLQFELWKTASGSGGSQQPAKVVFPYPKHIQAMGLTIVDDIVSCADSGGKPRCSATDARDALEIALALRESHRRGFVKVDLPLEDRSLGIISAEAREDSLGASATASGLRITVRHSIIYRDEEAYSPWPVLWPLPDGGIAAGAVTSPIGSHPGASTHGTFLALVSHDEGQSWSPSDDPAHPANWPAGTVDEHMDRFATILADGSFITVGTHGFEAWDAGRLDEARAKNRWVRKLPERPDSIAVQSPMLCSQRSTDGGKTWHRREWEVPGVKGLWCFNRAAICADGTVIVGVYALDEHDLERPYVLRSTDGGCTWRLHDLCSRVIAVPANETAICETTPGTLTAIVRGEFGPGDHHLLQLWSDDGGKTWTEPIKTDIWGHPAHLMKLNDGRILCSHGYRRDPRGVRAVFSEDGGETWDVANSVILRDDSTGHSPYRGEGTGVGDVGYPVSVQLPDGDVLTAYYITPADNVTHSAVTRWTP